jgi:hypothetical protein
MIGLTILDIVGKCHHRAIRLSKFTLMSKSGGLSCSVAMLLPNSGQITACHRQRKH